MLTRKRNILLLVLSLIVISAISVFGAFAQDSTETPPDTSTTCPMMGTRGMGVMGGYGQGMMGNWDINEHPMFVAIATALELSPEELFAELQAGKTLTEIATEAGIDIELVYDAALAAHETHLASLVEAGTITQEQADACQSWMETNFANMPMFNGLGFGPCHNSGMGGRGRMGGRGMGRGGW